MSSKSTGYCNKNYALLLPNSDDGLFLRLINPKIPNIMDTAVKAMLYLKRRKIGAELLLTFKNGLVMEFLPGEVITWDNVTRIKEKDIWLAAAREMARYHSSTNLDDIEDVGVGTGHEFWKMHMELMKSMAEARKLDLCDYGFPSLDECFRLKEELYNMIKESGADYTFTHLDSNPPNCIITKDGVVFVDYDFCVMEYCVHEMAGFLCTTLNVQDPNLDDLPTESEEEMFIREYLRSRAELEPSRGDVTDKLVRFWQFLVRKAKLGTYLNFVIGVFMMKDIAIKTLETRVGDIFWQRYKEEEKYFYEKFEEK